MTWARAIKDLEERRSQAELGGGVAKIEKQHKQGKMTARERIGVLLDPGSFVEIDALVEARVTDFDVDKRSSSGDGVVVGYGTVDGRRVFVSSEDFTVIGGTSGEAHAQKICRIQDMALENRCPLVCINDSGGARIEEGIHSLNGYGGMFLRHTRASGVIPQIAVILGPCSGGASYAPALCDYIFMVKDTSKMFITGPNVVKAVVFEDVSAEELGGARVHATQSGVSHFTYESEKECLDGVRRLLSYLPDSCDLPAPVISNAAGFPDLSYKLQDIVPFNARENYDVKDVIECIVDPQSFLEVQSEFARNAVVGLARLEGKSVAVVANQCAHLAGSLDVNASDKIARFVRTCDCFNIPIITLVDVPAFLPGTNQEHSGIIRHGAKILFAYSEATVPKVTLIMRKAYGGAYIAMNSLSMGADLALAWPIAEIAVMGADGAVNIAFKRKIDEADDPEMARFYYKQQYEDRFLNPYVAASRGYVNAVIKPEETRSMLLKALACLRDKKVRDDGKKHGNIPL